MRTKTVIFGVFAAAAVALSAAPASADLVYYWQTGSGYCDTGCNGNYSYTVAETFSVNSSASIQGLSLYDSTQGTIGNDIYVALYNDTTDAQVGATIDFKGVTDPAKSFYVNVAFAGGPISLIAGDTYSIEAWGFTDGNQLYVHNSGNDNVAFNSLNGALTNYGSENCNGSTGVFQATNTALKCYRDMHGMNYWGAGSFYVPEPPGWALMLVGLAGLGFLGYRRRRQAGSLG